MARIGDAAPTDTATDTTPNRESRDGMAFARSHTEKQASGADMGMIAKSSQVALALVMCLCLTSCQGRSPQAVTLFGSMCSDGTPVAAPTQRVRAKFAPVEFLLPDQSFRSEEFEDQLERGEAWMGTDGLVVSYAVEDTEPWYRPTDSGDHNVLNCVEEIGGRPAEIRMRYSEATTVPGQRLSATWKLGAEYLTLDTFHPDSSHREELLAIVRSVRFVSEEQADTASAAVERS